MEITMYFYKLTSSVPDSFAPTSTSPLIPSLQDPKTARPVPPLTPLPQLTQCEDSKKKDLYDDPLPTSNSHVGTPIPNAMNCCCCC